MKKITFLAIILILMNSFEFMAQSVSPNYKKIVCAGSPYQESIMVLNMPSLHSVAGWYKANGLNYSSPSTGSPWSLVSGTSSSTIIYQTITQSCTYACRIRRPDNTEYFASGLAQYEVTTFTYGTIASGNQTFTALGDPASISVSTSSSNPGYFVSYQWYSKSGIQSAPTGNSTVGWTAITNANSTSFDPPVIRESTSYALMIKFLDQCNTSRWANGVRQITVNPMSITNANESLCTPADPSPITFTATPSAGNSFQWYYKDGIIAAPAYNEVITGWTPISGATATVYDPPSGLINSRTYVCRVTNGTYSEWVTGARKVTVGSVLNYGTIAALNETFAGSGDPSVINLSTAASGGSGTFTYQWYSASGIVAAPTGTTIPAGWTAISGATAASYDPPVISSSTSYALRTDPTGTPDCGAATWATGVRQITVNAFSPGAIASGNQSICTPADPASIAFSTAASAGSAFQWYYQDGIITAPANTAVITGWTSISGANAASYDPPSGLTTSRTYACRVISGTNSQWASGVRQITVNPVSDGVILSEPYTRCGSGPITFYGGSDFPGSDSYGWYSSATGGTLLGTGSPATINISEGTNTVWMSVTTSAGCTNPVRFPQSVSITSLTDFGVLSTGNQSLISPADPLPIDFISSPPTGFAPSSSPGYQWYFQNGIVAQPAGSNTTGWTLITGATNSNYDPPSGLTTSRTYACLVIRNLCGDVAWASGIRQITVTPFSPGTLASGNQTLCNPADPASIAFSSAASAGSTFLWYYQNGIITAPSNTAALTGWTAITGATTVSYDPPSGLTASRTYVCRVSNGTNSQWATGARQITVRAVLNYGTIAAGNQSFTGSGDPAVISLSTAASGGSGTFAYQWYSASGIQTAPTGTTIPAGWTAISGATTASYDPPVISASTSYALRTDPTGTPDCGVATWSTGVRQITITSGTTFSPGTLSAGNQTLCNGGDPASITFSTAATSGSAYQWYYQNGIIAAPANTAVITGWTSITGATAVSYDPPTGLTASRTYACRVTNGTNSQWATGVRQVTILPAFSPGSLITSQSGCVGYNPNPITMATNPQGSGAYNWKWFYVENTTATCPSGSADPTGWTTSTTDLRFFGTSSTGVGINFDPTSAGANGRTWVLKITPAANGSTPACGTAALTNCHRTSLLACRMAEDFSDETLNQDFHLGNAQPNPWNLITEIHFQLPSSKQKGIIVVRSLEGKIVYTQEISGNDKQSLTFRRESWPAGVYFYSLEAEGELIATKKMVLIQ